MIAWIDAYLLPLLVGTPLFGAFFVAVMPASDRIALRHAGMGAAIVTGLVALYAAGILFVEEEPIVLELALGMDRPLTLSLDRIGLAPLLALVLVVPMGLRAGAPRILERTKGYVALVLLFEVLALLALLSDSAVIGSILLDATGVPLLLLLGLFGGPLRGSTSMRVGMVWFVVDAAALASLAWLSAMTPEEMAAGTLALRAKGQALSPAEQALFLAPILLMASLRLGTTPLLVWLADIFREGPVSAVSFVPAVVLPLGALFLVRYGLLVLPEGAVLLLPWGVALSVLTALLAGLLALSERDLRQLVGWLAALHGATAALALLSLDGRALTAALLFLPAMSLATAIALFVIDGIERRYLTRDATELLGFAAQVPGLWRLLALGLGAAVGIPFLGGGAALFSLLVGVASSRAFFAAGLVENVALWAVLGVVVAWVLAAGGVALTLRRVTAPAVRQSVRQPSPLTRPQALRLWVPVLFAALFGLSLPSLEDRVLPLVRAEVERTFPFARALAGGVEREAP